MISAREVLTALYGALRLARFDPSGLDFFEQTETGFWRSFFAAVLVAPFYLMLTSIRYSGLTETVPFVRFLAIETIAYVIAWVAFPLLMAALTRSLGREAHYIRTIVAYNWAAVWQNALYMPVAMLSVRRRAHGRQRERAGTHGSQPDRDLRLVRDQDGAGGLRRDGGGNRRHRLFPLHPDQHHRHRDPLNRAYTKDYHGNSQAMPRNASSTGEVRSPAAASRKPMKAQEIWPRKSEMIEQTTPRGTKI